MPHDVQDEVVAPDLFFSYGDVVRREVAFLRQAVLEHGIGIELRIGRKFRIEVGAGEDVCVTVQIEEGLKHVDGPKAVHPFDKVMGVLGS